MILEPMQRIELMFGRNIDANADVGDSAWERFVAMEITPRFPDGITVEDAAGEWRDRISGATIHERSKVVVIATHDADAQSRVEEIVAAYKTQFHQQAVGEIVTSARAGF